MTRTLGKWFPASYPGIVGSQILVDFEGDDSLPPGRYVVGSVTRRDDAVLCAAAPELLEALRECAAYVKQEIDSLVESHTHPDTKQIDPDDLAYINSEREILVRAEAAIAKAEGR